jgi:hypothetical protein
MEHMEALNLSEPIAIGLRLLFFLMMLFFTIFSVATIYHWITFGSSKTLTMVSICTYLVVSAPLFLIMSISLAALQ